ncbi:MAG: excinuclease ABC subunit UvrB [Prevotellaceae bacterium]|jgi:excinuclease ABC subunit B|nr:excinuclease ABC subunit UvrB [Prevotellaceae bacterium]
MNFKLTSSYLPSGDQPQAIEELVCGVENGMDFQTLLGVTGSGKTFTMANVIAQLNRPALIISHNKTLAAQLYSEFKAFFPENAVEYFVSYYDYYQPEAYIPATDTYIEKDLAINSEIEKLRLSATSQLLSGRNDIIIIASVSCLFGIGNPENFKSNTISIVCGKKLGRDNLLKLLITAQYSRNEIDLNLGNFRVKGDTVDIFPAYADYILRIIFWGEEVDVIETLDAVSGQKIADFDNFTLYPANIFVITQEQINSALDKIAVDLGKQVEYFNEIGKPYEAKRIYERVNYDIEMIKEVGYCSGIENYSRYLDNRPEGSRPFCLFDYFPKNFIVFVDESHVTIPQVRGMYGGDASRKQNLVEYGFRLPAAKDNRPLKFEEYESIVPRAIFVSATPAEYELKKSQGVVVEQIVRPTGLLDPKIEVRPTSNQIDDLMEEIALRVEKNEQVLITTLTKRMAEELDAYLRKNGVKCNYIHSGVETLDRVHILEELRNGNFDVLIGVNLLREGLDLPQVSLVAILDADKEGFLRNHRSLTQTIGRAARHLNGMAIMYADKITQSMRLTIDETNRRRAKQTAYNQKYNIIPQQIISRTQSALGKKTASAEFYVEPEKTSLILDPVIQKMLPVELNKAIEHARKNMTAAAAKLEFIEAAQWRDEMLKLEELKEKKQ